MALFLAYQNRGLTKDVMLLNANEDTITPGANDRIRAIIGRVGEEPKLTVASDAPTEAGSIFTKGLTNRLRLDADDLYFEAGVYTITFDYYDHANASEWSTVSKQVFYLESTFKED